MSINNSTIFVDYPQFSQSTEEKQIIDISLSSIYDKTSGNITIDLTIVNLTITKIRSCKITIINTLSVYNFVSDQTICVLRQITNSQTLSYGYMFVNEMDIIMKNKLFVTSICQLAQIQLIGCNLSQPYIDSFFVRLKLIIVKNKLI